MGKDKFPKPNNCHRARAKPVLLVCSQKKGWTDRGRVLLTGSPRALTAIANYGFVGLQRRSLAALSPQTDAWVLGSLAEPRLLGRGEGLVHCLYATCSSGMLGYVITNRKTETLRNADKCGGAEWRSLFQVAPSRNGLCRIIQVSLPHPLSFFPSPPSLSLSPSLPLSLPPSLSLSFSLSLPPSPSQLTLPLGNL